MKGANDEHSVKMFYMLGTEAVAVLYIGIKWKYSSSKRCIYGYVAHFRKKLRIFLLLLIALLLHLESL